jgi:hypothetical protein
MMMQVVYVTAWMTGATAFVAVCRGSAPISGSVIITQLNTYLALFMLT